MDIVCGGQEALVHGRELAVVQIYFRATFDCISHTFLLYEMQFVGVGVAVFDVTAGLLSGRVQRVVVDGVRSENVRVVSGVPQGKVMGNGMILLYTSDLQEILENTLVGFADGSTLLAEVPDPSR